MEFRILRVLLPLGIPGVALGVFYLLLRAFNFQFSTIDSTWAAIIAMFFLLIVGVITFYALKRYAPVIENGNQKNRKREPKVTIDMTTSDDRTILVQDEAFLDGCGRRNIFFPRFISRREPTPEIKVNIVGITTSGSKVSPKLATCTVFYADGKQRKYKKGEDEPLFVLPRTKEAIDIRISLAFEKIDENLQRIQAIVVDEYERETSQVREVGNAM